MNIKSLSLYIFNLSFINKSLSQTLNPPNHILGGDLDDNHCLTVAGFTWCNQKNKCIHPWLETCPDDSSCPTMNCDLVCPGGYEKKNNCDTCKCMIEHCNNFYQDCNNDYVCPKITQITGCHNDNDGIDGYITYQLSLIVKNDNILNIYAIYGEDEHYLKPLIIPPAFQGDSIFNNNIGGIPNEFININSDSQYDSWLTIGLTNGDPFNKISTIGIDFTSWNENTGIYNTNGAVFLMDPEELIQLETYNEYVVAQLTVPESLSYDVIMNVQGKNKLDHDNRVDYLDDNSWREEGVIFHITPINQKLPLIPPNCNRWYDGCNVCNIVNGNIQSCTESSCLFNNDPLCLLFVDGH